MKKKLILPHERKMIVKKLAGGEEANHQASEDMQEALDMGDQWHDNPAYDAIIARMNDLDTIYTPLIRLLRSSTEAKYPDPDSSIIALGSLATLEDGDETYDALLVSTSVVGEETYRDQWISDNEGRNTNDLLLVGTESPVRQSVLGLSVGGVAEWTVQHRTLSAKVIAVDNLWVTQFNISS